MTHDKQTFPSYILRGKDYREGTGQRTLNYAGQALCRSLLTSSATQHSRPLTPTPLLPRPLRSSEVRSTNNPTTMVRKTITTEVRGRQCGTAYDDKKLLKDQETSVLERIVLCHDEYVNSLAVSTVPSDWTSMLSEAGLL